MQTQTNELVSYQYQLRKMGIDELKSEYEYLISKSYMTDADYSNIKLINALSVQLTGKYINENN